MSQESPSEPLSPKPKLTDTPAGQSVFVGLWIAGTLLVLAAAAGAFVLGQNAAGGDESEVVAVDTEMELEVFPELTGIAQAPGVWAWDELRGGECIAGFEGAFAEEFTVVSCVGPHDAQLISAQLLSGDVEASYPGEEQVLATARERCDVRELVDYSVAENYADLVVDYSYPVTTEQWDSGARGVYCFVIRQSGEQIDGDLLP
jgi:hypothetical protein